MGTRVRDIGVSSTDGRSCVRERPGTSCLSLGVEERAVMKILIAGATGFLGKKLGVSLVKKGHRIWVISRDAKKAKAVLPYPCEVIEGDLSEGIVDHDSFQENFEVVINLAGESVAG